MPSQISQELAPLMLHHHLIVKVNGLTDGLTKLIKLKSIWVFFMKFEIQANHHSLLGIVGHICWIAKRFWLLHLRTLAAHIFLYLFTWMMMEHPRMKKMGPQPLQQGRHACRDKKRWKQLRKNASRMMSLSCECNCKNLQKKWLQLWTKTTGWEC